MQTFKAIAIANDRTVRTVRGWWQQHKDATGIELGEMDGNKRVFSDEDAQILVSYSGQQTEQPAMSGVIESAASDMVGQILQMDTQADQIGEALAPRLERHLSGQSIFDAMMKRIDKTKVAARLIPTFDNGFIEELQIEAMEIEERSANVHLQFEETLNSYRAQLSGSTTEAPQLAAATTEDSADEQ